MYKQTPITDMLKDQITYSTQCYDNDYLNVLSVKRLQNINETLNGRMDIIINKSNNYNIIKVLCESLKTKNLINNYYSVDENIEEILKTFNIKRENFSNNLHFNICLYGMGALYFCKTDYLCFFTGDSTPLYVNNFVSDCIKHDKNNEKIFTYMLRWSNENCCARNESYMEDENFLYTQGFSDTNFLINVKRFNYQNLLQEFSMSSLFPHIDAFEARFHAYMKANNINRCVYKHGEYLHRNY